MNTIPCTFIDDDVDTPTIRIRQLVENCQREDLPPLEFAQAIASLAELTSWSNRRIAKELGFNHTTIGRYLDLLRLPEAVQQQVDNDEIAPSVAVQMLKIEDAATQSRVSMQIAENKLNRNEAKQLIASTADGHPGKKTEAKRSSRKQSQELLSQTLNVAVYRNPQASNWRVKEELVAIVEQLETEKAEN